MNFSFFSKQSRPGPIQTAWHIIRKRKIWLGHDKVYDFWKPIVEDYHHNKIDQYDFKAKVVFDTDKIIWQYWGQGFADGTLPEVVRTCVASVDVNKDDYHIVRLDDNNISDYLDLPSFVLKKRYNPEFTRTFFSDLLRVCLLNTYGGVWLDATILLTKPLPSYWQQLDYFVFQRDDTVIEKQFWEHSYAYYWGWNKRFRVRMLNSILVAKKGTPVIRALQDLLLYYWKGQESILNYFFFQILYNVLLESNGNYKTCPLVSDTLPHLLQTKINNPASRFSYQEALKHTGIHKMSYFGTESIRRFNQMVEEILKNTIA
ncbi:capsular polysaccharide synthesis protein [Sphingobacterium suaedae]|uniref:Capsular polysaccharide synthesis protein n=1 Tax=Sphingobacterium suaedae TaxID=1686402 RepID=A0ABW5KKM2_9SPHI